MATRKKKAKWLVKLLKVIVAVEQHLDGGISNAYLAVAGD